MTAPVPPHPDDRRPRLLAIADSDSYVKWGAALAERFSPEWDRDLVVLQSPLQPSESQLAAAVAGTVWSDLPPEVLPLESIGHRIADATPDVVLLSLRGPMVKVVLRVAVAAAGYAQQPRPVFVGGLPGISIPATRKAIAYRAQLDLLVLHSRREVREFAALAERMGVPHRFGLGSLPFLPRTRLGRIGVPDDAPLVFAAQAKVPAERSQRVELLGWLAEAARRHPLRRVVIKVRAQTGEAQTHAEQFDYRDLLPELHPPAPPNLVVEGGSMATHLAGAAGLVTVSSTAAIEAVGMGVPVLVLDSFGVSPELINTVFEQSGLLGGSDELVAGDLRHPVPGWLDDNYFHRAENDDWLESLGELVAARDAGVLTLKPQPRGTSGGRLRLAWDRKRALGSHDRSVAGAIALAVGWPLMRALRLVRRLRRLSAPPASPASPAG